MKKEIVILLSVVLCLTLFVACGGKTEGSADEEKTTVSFWHFDGNPTSTPIFEELINRFEAKFPQYEVEFVALPVDSYLQKYNTAIVTNSVPDVFSVRDQDLSSFYAQDALMPLDEVFDAWEEKDLIDAKTVATVRNTVADKKLYAIPQYITLMTSWVNTQALEEDNIPVPESISDFMAACETIADAQNNEYFFSLRGGTGSLEALFDFMYTCANKNIMFDEEGNCDINGEKFVEAFELYASIYWNGWTTRDSVTNGFKEIVAEFGSKTSDYIMHNSSSLPEHQKNLGEGNFLNVIPPANEEGITVMKGLSYVGYGIPNGAKNVEGAKELVKFMASEDGSTYLCENEGRIPVNSGVYEHEWYANDPYMQGYQAMLESDNVKFLDYPIWLPEWNEFRSKHQEPGLQAVLLKDRTAQEVLDEWAEFLSAAQKKYLASIK